MLIDEKDIEKEMLRILVQCVAKNVKNTICYVIISSDEMQAICLQKSKLSICWVHPWTEMSFIFASSIHSGSFAVIIISFQALLLLNAPLEQFSGLSAFFLMQLTSSISLVLC